MIRPTAEDRLKNFEHIIYGKNKIIADSRPDLLPFFQEDVTAGAENEFQTAVIGSKNNIDLAVSIEESSCYKNMKQQFDEGDASPRKLEKLKEYLDNNKAGIWENSWVSFPKNVLNKYSLSLFKTDILSDKSAPRKGIRDDVSRFIFTCKHGKEMIRVPVSYLLKLSLADSLFEISRTDHNFSGKFRPYLDHFLNDNTSPETFSFYPAHLSKEGKNGTAAANETSRRFLLTQLLTAYANTAFKLTQNGQKTTVYCSPVTPVRQKQLNDCVSDSFYRELFMSPCLSGWDRGKDKFDYMNLCHQVFSRSQLHCISRLKEAGILFTNLAYVPNISNVSLANNGTHITLGSKKLTGLLDDKKSGFTQNDEKYFGDLAIKITEHFLPLFVNTYSAAPFRFDFWEFHPETVMGFLPHELNSKHLQMIWRSWKEKTNQRFAGNPVTPFGICWLDKLIAKTLRLKGDIVPDFRLLDYMAAVLSTSSNSALDGTLGNDDRLKRDLTVNGIYHESMSLYMLYKMRYFSQMGFSGFEGRFYSQFSGYNEDMSPAVTLQSLITSLSYHYILRGGITHKHIPDTVNVESERRQIFFSCALGLPAFYIYNNSQNIFLQKIMEHTTRSRNSNRYKGYIRVKRTDYLNSLVKIIESDGARLIEANNCQQIIDDLKKRINQPDEFSCGGKLQNAILNKAGVSSYKKISANDYNLCAESYYRNELREKQINESLILIAADCKAVMNCSTDEPGRDTLKNILKCRNPYDYVMKIKEPLITEKLDRHELCELINMVIGIIGYYKNLHDKEDSFSQMEFANAASVY